MAGSNRTDDIDITKDELNQIKEAFKKEEFRKLFVDYVEEVNDPKNKAIFEKEITEYEKERGINVTFIHPKPGYALKTSVNGNKKAFINVCENDKIAMPSAQRSVQGGSSGLEWSLPYIQAPPRDDLDKNRKLCVVYDVIFHPLTIEMAKKDSRMKKFVNDSALSAVENSYGVSLDRNNLKFPKLPYKGYKHPCVIRKKCDNVASGSSEMNTDDDPLEIISSNPYYPYSEPASEPIIHYPTSNTEKGCYTTPKYLIKHRKNLDLQEFTYSRGAKLNTNVANELLIEIHLPLISSASDVEVNLSERTLSLKSESPAKYELNLPLPYFILEAESSAKFDASKRILLVTAIVDRQKHCLPREDSGVESDPSRGLSSSSDEDISKTSCHTSKISCPTSDDKPDRGNTVKLVSSDSVDAGIPSDTEVISETTHEKEDSSSEAEAMSIEEDKIDPFLNPDIYYSLPTYSLYKNASSNFIFIELHVKNVEPSSTSYIFSEDISQFQIKFYSMGSGFVQIYYTACIRLNSSSFIPSSVKVDVCDDVCIKIGVRVNEPSKFHSVFIGSEPSSLKEELLSDSVPSTSVFWSKTDFGCDITDKKKSGDIILKLSKLRLYSTAEDDSDDCEDEDEDDEDDDIEADQLENMCSSALMKAGTEYIDKKSQSSAKCDKKTRRTVSESSDSSPIESVIKRRSILKISRSLSESNANDYSGFSMSMDSEDGYVPQENGLVKKHVRFSDTIYKKVFRANSSILGQRKKNQRKAKNKKRSVERRTSESSGVSESEISELEVSEVSDMSEVSDVSETSESDDGSTIDKLAVPQTPCSKAHRRKGKKNHRKSANTAKINCLFDCDN